MSDIDELLGILHATFPDWYWYRSVYVYPKDAVEGSWKQDGAFIFNIIPIELKTGVSVYRLWLGNNEADHRSNYDAASLKSMPSRIALLFISEARWLVHIDPVRARSLLKCALISKPVKL